MCLLLPACQDLYLASGMPAPAPTPPPDSIGPELSTAPGASQTPVRGFPVHAVVPGVHRRQRTGERREHLEASHEEIDFAVGRSYSRDLSEGI